MNDTACSTLRRMNLRSRASRRSSDRMDARAVDAFIRDLNTIVDQATDRPLRPLDFGVSWTRADNVLTIAGASAATFFETVGKLSQRAVWRERVSEEYIEAQLVPILFALRDDGLEHAKALFVALADAVENYEIERVAYVPVDQINLEVEQLRVGQVVFRIVDDA